jgi:flagellar assembly protein FliH
VLSGRPSGSYAPASVVLDADALASSGLTDDLVSDLFTSAPEVAERVRRLGYEEGYRAAQADGVRDAAAERDLAVSAVARRLSEVAAAALAERQSVVDEVVGDAVDLALELLGALVDHELACGTPMTRDALVRALAVAPVGEDLVVRLPPGSGLTEDDVASLASRAVAVRVDPGVESGGCVVEAGPSRIDAQIGAAIDRVREQLDRVRPAPGPGRSR